MTGSDIDVIHIITVLINSNQYNSFIKNYKSVNHFFNVIILLFEWEFVQLGDCYELFRVYATFGISERRNKAKWNSIGKMVELDLHTDLC